MASSTRKWRKQQKEYNRRRRQATRRREEQNKIREEKKKQNLLSEVLGITSAVGFNKNVYPQARVLSKDIQSNYLIEGLRKKKIREKLQRVLKDYNKNWHTSELHWAVSSQDPYAVQFLLEKNSKNIDTKDYDNHTPLDVALTALINLVDAKISGDMYYQEEFLRRVKVKEENVQKLIRILQLIMEKNPKISQETLVLFWELGPTINVFLQQYPNLRALSYENKDAILSGLKRVLRNIHNEMEEHRWNNNGGYGDIPDELYEQEEYYDNCLKQFNSFIHTYDTKRGTYSLQANIYAKRYENNENNENNGNKMNKVYLSRMPRLTRKQRKRRQTRKQKQRGGSNEKPTLENVLGISSIIGYNRNTLVPGLQLSKRSASNYLTQVAYENAIVKKGLFELWSKEPQEIEAKLKENPRLKQFSIQEAKKILRKFYQKFDDIEMFLEERRYSLQYGRNAHHIVEQDIEDFEEMKANLVNKLEYFEDFLAKESPGLLGTIHHNNNNNYANYYSNNRNNYNNNNYNNNNNQNNNYGNAMRQLFQNQNE